MTVDLTACPEPDCLETAEVIDRFTLQSTSGPVEHVATFCVANHRRIHIEEGCP